MATIQWSGDGFDPFRLMLERFQDSVRDAAPAFERMADHQAKIWAGAFRSEGSSMAEGKWQALSPDYGAFKARNYPGRGILEREGTLKDSLTRRPFGVDEVTDTQMIIGTAVDYARYHQSGAGNLPRRQMVGDPDREDVKVFAKFLHEHIIGDRTF